MPAHRFDDATEVPKNVVDVCVPNGIREIPGIAFKECKELESITFPINLVCIGYSAFYGCCKLKKITIPSSVISIGNEAFFGCFSLEEINLPAGLSSIGDNAFRQCVSLVSVDLPSSLERLGGKTGGVFHECSSLKEISIPSKITTLPPRTFSCCSALENVTLPPTIEEIKKEAFLSCASLRHIELPSSIGSIHPSAFNQCTHIEIDKVKVPALSRCKEPFHISNLPQLKNSGIRLREGPGPQFGFRGQTQNGYGPEWWGVSLDQIMAFKKHPLYYRLGKDGQPDYLIRDIARDWIEPATDGAGIGYALLLNQDRPLRAKVLVSETWDCSLQEFVGAIECSGEEGPFWIGWLSIYQNNDPNKGVTIGQQLRADPEYGLFNVVQKRFEVMLQVPSRKCNIFTRLWIVYEMFQAIESGVKVRLSSNIKSLDLYMGHVHRDTYVLESRYPPDCKSGHAPINEDEIAIRRAINATEGGFDKVDREIDTIRLAYLVTYPLYHVVYGKTTARDYIRKSIEAIFLRLPQNRNFISFEEFVGDEVYHKCMIGERPDNMTAEDANNYYHLTTVKVVKGDPDWEKKVRVNGMDEFDKWLCSILREIKQYSRVPTINNFSTRLKQGHGATLDFGGRTQRGYGPEWWGVSLEQVKNMKQNPMYYRVGADGMPNYTMREFSKDTIEPATDGLGIGYALLHNQDKPLKAKIMVSHAWEEPIQEFVEAIERSGEEGPFWICALAVYQNHVESQGVTIQQQLGSDPSKGPFATVITEVDLMLAVMTSGCDIYTRLWCVYEMYIAIQKKKEVRLCPHINPDDLIMGRTDNDICVVEAKKPVDSKVARCGDPKKEQNSDEITIRKDIKSEFETVDSTIERIRLNYLVTYPLQLGCRKTTARDKIKESIELILKRIDDDKLVSFDNYLREFHPGSTIAKTVEKFDDMYSIEDHIYYIIEDDTNKKVDVFEEWIQCLSMENASHLKNSNL